MHVSNSHSNNGQNDEQPDLHMNVDYMQKRTTRVGESENQRNIRLAYQRKRSASNRSGENDEQRNARVTNQQERSASNRSSENEEQRNARVTNQRKRSATNRLSKSQQRKTPRLTFRQQNSDVIPLVMGNQRTAEQNQGINIERQQRVLEENQQVLIDQYKWPAAIPTHLKEYCLEDFCNNISMSVLRQSICMICNIRASVNTMREYDFQNIPNLEKLSCHTDLMDIIAKTSQVTQSGNFNNVIVFINI
jgi:hypothetical protein